MIRILSLRFNEAGFKGIRNFSVAVRATSPPLEESPKIPNFVTKELSKTLPQKVQHVEVIKPKLEEDFKLQSGATIPKESIQIKYSTFGTPDENKPIILLCPSMSNSVFAMDEESDSENSVKGWWRQVIGKGPHFGIDIDKFFVVCGAPLGSPFGSSSPITINSETGKRWGPTFPQVTPKDQAKLQSVLLESLGIKKVFAVVGGSMGGMQSIQFAVNHSKMYDLFVSIASTAQTSPGIVALRCVQREAVRMDPDFKDGWYYQNECGELDENFRGPVKGLRVARMFGTICYRSHDEFVERFDWYPSKKVIRKEKDEFAIQDAVYDFDVENYLNAQADNFISRSRYDANCYLLNSKSMDLMDIGGGEISYEEAVRKIPSTKRGLLLSYSTDRLTPPEDFERFSSILGRYSVPNHFEILRSIHGHDAFLIEREATSLNIRLKAFLEGKAESAVDRVHKLFKELYHQ